MPVLVTGASGYIGGRLVPQLLARGHDVRVLVRHPDQLQGRPWANLVEIFPGDLTDPGSLQGLCDGIDVAYYLVHSMISGTDYVRRDRTAVENYISVAGNVDLTIYLGGLLPRQGTPSAHLRSRAQVGATLRANLPATEIRAGPIVGSGSASFEMIRYLTERHPIMVVPQWLKNEVQPIAVRDVLSYLLATLQRPPLGVMEVGSNRLTFAELLLEYAAVRGLQRHILPLPFMAPRLIALWASFTTPVPFRVCAPLLIGMAQPVLADTRRARKEFPGIQPISYRRAVELALERIQEGRVQTRWTGALGKPPTRELMDREGMMCEVRTRHVNAGAERVHQVVTGLGGDRGWLVWNRVWWVRGLMDRLLGGPGLRRGRRHPQHLLPGETVDFWRVERVNKPEMLRLRAEMKVPGRAWLQWETVPEEEGSRLVQTALFQPKGLAGFLYWYLLYPIHAGMFSRLASAIAREAEAHESTPDDPAPGQKSRRSTRFPSLAPRPKRR